jgi:hypothetical protein
MKNKYWKYRHIKGVSLFDNYIEYSCKLQLITLYIYKDKGQTKWWLEVYNNLEKLVKSNRYFDGNLKNAKLEVIAMANKYLEEFISNANKDMGQLG